jgi:hypothetical protein
MSARWPGASLWTARHLPVRSPFVSRGGGRRCRLDSPPRNHAGDLQSLPRPQLWARAPHPPLPSPIDAAPRNQPARLLVLLPKTVPPPSFPYSTNPLGQQPWRRPRPAALARSPRWERPSTPRGRAGGVRPLIGFGGLSVVASLGKGRQGLCDDPPARGDPDQGPQQARPRQDQ